MRKETNWTCRICGRNYDHPISICRYCGVTDWRKKNKKNEKFN